MGTAVAALARKICAIPAPTFHEAERAAFVAEQFRARGLAPLGDPAGNVTTRRVGTRRDGTLLFAAPLATPAAHLLLDTDGRRLVVVGEDGRLTRWTLPVDAK